jgi:hypothetical protein
MYQHPFAKSWTFRNRRPTAYRTSSNSAVDPNPASFSSASTLYEKEQSRSPSRGPNIKRKPLPQPKSVPGEFPSRPSPYAPSAMMSGARQLDDYISNLPNNRKPNNGLSSLEAADSVTKCPCGRICHVEPRWHPIAATSRRTSLDRTAPTSGIKKSSSTATRYFLT